MKVLVFGSGGMLGHKLIQVLRPHAEVWGTLHKAYGDFGRFDILEEARCVPNVDAELEADVRRAVEMVRPDVVLNAIGVVKQLPISKDYVRTITINSLFPHRLAHLGDEYDFRLITVSTDCVFDGERGNYVESDRPNAADLYGKSKHLGEVEYGRALTIRTSIIGRELTTSHGLVEWFLSNAGGRVKGFTEAIFSGFPTVTLATIMRDIIFEHPDINGLYHVSSEPINKFELLNLLKDILNVDVEIQPSKELRIDRSLNSDRFRQAVGFRPSDWPTMIGEMAADQTPYSEWK